MTLLFASHLLSARRRRWVLLLSLLCAMPLVPRAEEPTPFWSEVRESVDLSVSAGARHEDNLVVEELDSVSRESGSAWVGSVDLDLEHELAGGRELGAGYFMEQRTFEQHPEYDLGLHYGYGDLSQRLGPVRVTTRLDGSVAYLGGTRLLENRQIGMELSSLVNRSLYVRGELSFKQTDLLQAPERNNDDTRTQLAGYYFLDGTSHYVSANYRFSAKRAQQFRFDYDAHRFGLLYNRRLSSWATLKLDWRYEERQYLSDTSTTANGVRLDERQRWRARLEVPFTERWELELRYEHRDYASNLDSVDYTDNRLEARLTLELL
ncbi:surface lipoprotein assembly modifier [Marinimicrobium agarilyticum]|uniref:surface lipoprotein assembly modifier n=1 Tax=Marinimicrobium agarilyticum TaxID=306546 RepID=UPI0004290A17|nr:surface lipoprotein assembly modifier [Marinimicrobium agarilyticum]